MTSNRAAGTCVYMEHSMNGACIDLHESHEPLLQIPTEKKAVLRKRGVIVTLEPAETTVQ